MGILQVKHCGVPMKIVVLFLFAFSLHWLFTRLGIPNWAILALTTVFLIFYRRIMATIVQALHGLSGLFGSQSTAGGRMLASLASWLIEEEGVATPAPATGAQAVPDTPASPAPPIQYDADALQRQSKTKTQAIELFNKHRSETVYLVPERKHRVQSKSHVGGLPHLPNGVTWPVNRGAYLHFLAEIYLDELPFPPDPSELPRTGVLFFFLDMSDASDYLDGQVLYAENAGAAPTHAPAELAELNWQFTQSDSPAVLQNSPVRSIAGHVLDMTAVDSPDMSKTLTEALQRADEAAYRQAIEDNGGSASLIPGPYRYNMVGGPKLYIANSSEGAGVKLLQLDSNADLGLMIGDAGVVEFWIDPEDCRARSFDKAYVTMGSC